MTPNIALALCLLAALAVGAYFEKLAAPAGAPDDVAGKAAPEAAREAARDVPDETDRFAKRSTRSVP